MGYIKIFKRDDRPMNDLKLEVQFKINGQPHFDWEDLGAFSSFAYLGIDARTGTRRDNGTWVGNILHTKQRGDAGPLVLQIDKEDDRKITDLRLTVSFTIGGAMHSDFEDLGDFDSDIILDLNSWGGGWNAEHQRYEGNFLRRLPATIGSYVGLRPPGKPTPELMQIQFGSTAHVSLNLAFVVTGPDGTMQIKWDTDHLTPQVLKNLRSANPRIRCLASVGGASAPWQDPTVDDGTWARNAVSSLSGIIDGYQLDGVDFDYEWDPDKEPARKFVSLVGGLIAGLKSQNRYISLAPYGVLWNFYRSLYLSQRDSIDLVKFQSYADENRDVKFNLDRFTSLFEAVDPSKLGFGICTATDVTRGITDVKAMQQITRELWGRGVRNFWTFCLEDSVLRGYEVERALEDTLKGLR